MNTNLLTINIGNTHTQMGLFVDDQLKAKHVIPTRCDDQWGSLLQRLCASIGEKSDVSVLLASVAPAAQLRMGQLIKAQLGAPIYQIEGDLNVPIGRQLDHEAIVGVDRLLNAAAAYDVLKQACVVVDAGTAITIDFIDGAGTFHGGAIAPGGQMMLDSLRHGTAALPQVQLAKPDEPIGHNTTQAMLTAVFYGVRGMVRELVEQYAHVAGVYPVVVATGGDAQMLFDDDELVERIVVDLTLMGMVVTFHAATRADP